MYPYSFWCPSTKHNVFPVWWHPSVSCLNVFSNMSTNDFYSYRIAIRPSTLALWSYKSYWSFRFWLFNKHFIDGKWFCLKLYYYDLQKLTLHPSKIAFALSFASEGIDGSLSPSGLTTKPRTCRRKTTGACPIAWASPIFAFMTSLNGLLTP